MIRDFSYTAFISYSHENSDKEFTKKLREKILQYKISPYVDFKVDFTTPRIFRDDENLQGGNLSKNIEYALNKSEFLIVVCSENSCKSDWVNKEVAFFSEQHGANNIIPIILSKNEIIDDQKLLCENLKKIELSSNEHLRFIGKEIIQDEISKSFLKLIALLHHCDDVESLTNWEKSKGQKKYYADYVDVKGMYKGIFELTEKQIKHRFGHYTFESDKEGKITRISYENSLGFPIGHRNLISLPDIYKNRPSIMELTYNLRGELESIINKDHIGTILNIQKFRKGGIIKYYESNGEDESFFENECFSLDDTDETNINSYSKTKISSIKIVRDDNGFLEKQLFFADDRAKYKTSSSQGIHGFQLYTDKVGRIIKKIFLDFNESPLEIYNSIGFAYTYDKKGNLIKINRLTKNIFVSGNNDSALCPFFPNCYNIRFEYDKYGNMISFSYTNQSEKLVSDPYSGFSKMKLEYNNNSFLIQATYLDENENFTSCIEGNYCFIKWDYNKYGDICSESYFDKNNSKCKNYGEGYHKKEFIYDEKRLLVEVICKNENNNKIMSKNSYSQIINQYDEKTKKLIRETTLSPNDEVIDDWEFIYNSDNLLIEEVNHAVPYDGKHLFRETYEKDDYGNTIEENFWTAISYSDFIKVTKIKTNRYEYDDSGKVIRLITITPKKQTANNTEQLANVEIVKFIYDENGKPIREIYLDENGEPRLNENNTDEVFIQDGLLNDSSNFFKLKMVTFFGKDVFHRKNVTQSKHIYISGMLSEIQEYGINIEGRPGISKIQTYYNDIGHPKTMTFHDENNNIIGKCLIEHTADGFDIQSFFGTAIINIEGVSHKKEIWKNGKLIELIYYDANDNILKKSNS